MRAGDTDASVCFGSRSAGLPLSTTIEWVQTTANMRFGSGEAENHLIHVWESQAGPNLSHDQIPEPNPIVLIAIWFISLSASLGGWYGLIRLGVWIVSKFAS